MHQHDDVRFCKTREMTLQVYGHQTYSRLLSDGELRNRGIEHTGAASLILKRRNK